MVPIRDGDKGKAGIAGLLTAALVLLCALGPSYAQSSLKGERQRDALLFSPQGIAPELQGGEPGSPVRVAILMRDQLVLREALTPAYQARLVPSVPVQAKAAAIGSPDRITSVEKLIAARAEQERASAIASLAPAADAARMDQAATIAAVRDFGGHVLGQRALPSSVFALVSRGALPALAARPDVQAIDPAPKPEPLLDVAVPAVGAPAWWQQGYTGGDGASDSLTVDVGMYHDYPETDHPAFADVDFDQQEAPDEEGGTKQRGHGTMTTSVIASRDATYRGAAPGIDTVISGDLDYMLGLLDNGERSPDPAEVINYSFSGGGIDAEDVALSAFGVTMSAGAGNNLGQPPGTVGIAAPAAGRNVIAMGGTETHETISPEDDTIADVSRWGPYNERKKPDIVAPARMSHMASSGWNNTDLVGSIQDPDPNDPIRTFDDWIEGSGTSFSAPLGSAGAALLWGSGVTDPNAQKAILINSARPGRVTPEQPMGTQTGWQPDWGWGMLDLERALAERGFYASSSVGSGEARFYGATVAGGEKATLTWRLRGTYTTRTGANLAYTLTDLDLHQYRAADRSEVPPSPDAGFGAGPDSQDRDDSVEQVRAPTGGQQSVIYKVEAVSNVVGVPAEPFALAAQAPLDPLDPPSVRLAGETTDASGPRACGQDVRITTRLANDSADLPADAAQVSLALPAGTQLVSGSPIQTVAGGSLAAGAISEERSWTVRATSEGAKTFTITGQSETMGEPSADTAQVSFTADCTPPETSDDVDAAWRTEPQAVTLNSPAPDLVATYYTANGSNPTDPTNPARAIYDAQQKPTLGNGQRLRYYSIDVAGNAESVKTSPAALVDTAAPQAFALTSPANGATTSERRPVLSWQPSSDADSGLDGYRVVIDGQSVASLGADTTAYSPTTPLDWGSHRWQIKAIDGVGRTTVSEERTLVIDPLAPSLPIEGGGSSEPEGSDGPVGPGDPVRADTTPPKTTITQGPSESRTIRRTARFTFTASEPDASFECSLDGSRFRNCFSPKRYRNLDTGRHAFRVRATDPAGNTDLTPARHRWKVARRR